MPKFNDTTIYGDLTVTGTISGNIATTTVSGLMSTTDKSKLDSIDEGAQKNTVISVNSKIDAVELAAGDIPFNGIYTNYLTAKTEVEGAIKELDTKVKTNADNVALKVNTSDIVNDLISTDVDKPLSANQGKVLNDTTAKLAVSNVFIQPQVVPNAVENNEAVNLGQLNTVVSIWRYEE